MKKSTITVDLLATTPTLVPFSTKVKELRLSPVLEEKILQNLGIGGNTAPCNDKLQLPALAEADEKELATEMLLYRHKFTEQTFQYSLFRQASLTIIQNIYLFKNRKIFFGHLQGTPEMERQEGLLLFSQPGSNTNLPLNKTFQHLVLAQIWNRILSTGNQKEKCSFEFLKLHNIVEKLNTLRNIYMILSHRLVHKLVKNINAVYKESITYEDAVQIGSFGIARAAYRYHHSHGFRFSTHAANWVFKEIQRQALQGRLIKISADTVQQYAKAAKNDNQDNLRKIASEIASRTAVLSAENECNSMTLSNVVTNNCPVARLEAQQLQVVILRAIDETLSRKSGDILKRRYGLPPYQGLQQSVIDISFFYGVTRGSIYQLEQLALKKLRGYLAHAE